ncbi:MAG: antibiotic biosynthesis monooxygenase family protein [Bacteroidota bacterium]
MIIVAGKLYIKPGQRDAFVSKSAEAVRLARQSSGCIDFAVDADSVDPDRVNVYEAWASLEALHAFRGAGPGDDLSALIVRAEVKEYEAAPRTG